MITVQEPTVVNYNKSSKSITDETAVVVDYIQRYNIDVKKALDYIVYLAMRSL